MTILGSVPVVCAVGNNTISMPVSGLTVVGISVYQNALQIQIDSSTNAIFLSQSGPVIQEVSFVVKTNSFTVTMLNGGSMVVFYYGIPRSASPKLEDYAGVLLSADDITIPTSGQPSETVGNVSFPGGDYIVTGYNMTAPTGMTAAGISGMGYINFQTILGQSLSVYGTVAGEQTQRIGKENIISLKQKMPNTLSYSYGIYVDSNPATAFTSGFLAVLYYSNSNSKAKA